MGGMVTLGDLAAKAPEAAPGGRCPRERYLHEPMPNIRKVIARAMLGSLTSMAQLTHNASFDCTEIQKLRKLFKEKGAERGMEKITLNDIILYAVSRTLANPDFRALNANLLSGDQMKYYRHVNLGVAVDTDRGLMVPTIFKADTLSLKEISQTAKKLASECKAGTINPDLLRDGSFTVTNLGSLGIESFTPVINPPQTGILGVNTIVNRVREVNGQLAVPGHDSLPHLRPPRAGWRTRQPLPARAVPEPGKHHAAAGGIRRKVHHVRSDYPGRRPRGLPRGGTRRACEAVYMPV